MTIGRSKAGPRAAVLLALVAGVGASSAATFEYSLPGPGPASQSGQHWVALPNTIDGVEDCGDLAARVPNFVSLERLDEPNMILVECTCPGGGCFAIEPGAGYVITVSADSDFTLDGTDGSTALDLSFTVFGQHLVSLPFATTLVDASDLRDSIGVANVASIQRFLTATDTTETFPPSDFALVPGEAYLVTLSSGVTWSAPVTNGDSCSSATSCTLAGRQLDALGAATIALEVQGEQVELSIGNIGPSGSDGVRITGPGLLPLFLGLPTDWIPLGVSGQRQIDVATTGPGTQLALRSNVQFTTLAHGPPQPVELGVTFEELAGDEIEIALEIPPAAGTTSLTFKVVDDGVVIESTTGQSLTATATANDWPIRQGLGVIQWADDVSLEIPGDPGVHVGDELWIVPDAFNAVETVNHVDFTLGCGADQATCEESPGLTASAVRQNDFPAPGEPLPPFVPNLLTIYTANGSVTSSPPGIACPATSCSAGFAVGSAVTLTPQPDPGFDFAGWGGAGCGASVSMTQHRYCTASFGASAVTHQLTVTKQGTGSGTITSSPAGVNCGADCSETYDDGTIVTLTATPAAHSVFTGFGGHADCADGSITMNADKQCTATFTLATYSLTVSRIGSGSGTVTSSPGGIVCGGDCSQNYTAGTLVSLLATPSPGSSFGAFGGHADCTAGSILMNASKHCTATFVLDEPPPPPPPVRRLPALGTTGRSLALLLLLAALAWAVRRAGR